MLINKHLSRNGFDITLYFEDTHLCEKKTNNFGDFFIYITFLEPDGTYIQEYIASSTLGTNRNKYKELQIHQAFFICAINHHCGV